MPFQAPTNLYGPRATRAVLANGSDTALYKLRCSFPKILLVFERWTPPAIFDYIQEALCPLVVPGALRSSQTQSHPRHGSRSSGVQDSEPSYHPQPFSTCDPVVSAMASNTNLWNHVKRGYQARETVEIFDELSRDMEKTLGAEVVSLLEKIRELKARPNLTQTEVAELEALSIRRWKKADRWRALRAFHRVRIDEEPNADLDVIEDSIARRLRREKVINAKVTLTLPDALDKHVQDIIAEQKSMSWPESATDGTSSTDYTALSTDLGSGLEDLQRAVDRRRERVKGYRVDRDASSARLQVINNVRRVKRAGLEYAPSEVIGPYELLRGAEHMMHQAEAEKAYRRAKKLMRRKNVLLQRVLSDDSEFSFDIEHDGSDVSYKPEGPALRSIKKLFGGI